MSGSDLENDSCPKFSLELQRVTVKPFPRVNRRTIMYLPPLQTVTWRKAPGLTC